MNLTPKGIANQITQFWTKQSKKMKAIVLASILGTAVLAVIIAALLNHKTYVVLYQGLSSAEAGKIMTRLDQLSVDSKIKDNGTILVPQDQEARLKMQLSSEGYPQSALSYDIFSNNSNFMTTDYEKKKYLIFQLQNRLQDAIKTLSGVENAIVTISVPDDNSYVLQTNKIPITASVLLNLSGSAELGKKQIGGIEELVAKSVPGLDGKNVAIVDGTGTMLNNTGPDNIATASDTRLELENSISVTVRDRIINLLQPVFGRSRLSVAVNTSIDMNKKVSEQTTYTPVIDKNGIVSKQSQTKENQNGGTAAGGVAGTGSNTGVVTYPTQAAGNAGGGSSESTSTDYLVNQLKEQVQHDGYEISDLSVAVIIGDTGLSKDELANYQQMVACAAGISASKVSVSGINFASDKNTANKNTSALSLAELLKGNNVYIFAASVFLLAIVALFLSRRRKHGKSDKEEFEEIQPKHKKRDKKDKTEEEEEEEPDIQAVPEKKIENMPGEIVLNETREQVLKKQIKDFASSSPDIVAQLLRTWIKEDDDKNG